MAGLDREQLDALRQQVEEDFRLDMAAIERLQRRFGAGSFSTPATSVSSANNGSAVEPRATVLAPVPGLPEPQSDELTGSIRAMFNTYRK